MSGLYAANVPESVARLFFRLHSIKYIVMEKNWSLEKKVILCFLDFKRYYQLHFIKENTISK